MGREWGGVNTVKMIVSKLHIYYGQGLSESHFEGNFECLVHDSVELTWLFDESMRQVRYGEVVRCRPNE